MRRTTLHQRFSQVLSFHQPLGSGVGWCRIHPIIQSSRTRTRVYSSYAKTLHHPTPYTTAALDPGAKEGR